jgi:hypothetical protein
VVTSCRVTAAQRPVVDNGAASKTARRQDAVDDGGQWRNCTEVAESASLPSSAAPARVNRTREPNEAARQNARIRPRPPCSTGAPGACTATAGAPGARRVSGQVLHAEIRIG